MTWILTPAGANRLASVWLGALIALIALMAACGGDSTSLPPLRDLLPAPTELPGSGWIVVGDDDFQQFDLPRDTSAVIDECRETVSRARSIEQLQEQRRARAVRLYRSSRNVDSVQVTVYPQSFESAIQGRGYLEAAVEADTGPAMIRCFVASNSGGGIEARAVPAEPRMAAPADGKAFAREVRYTGPTGTFGQRFEAYWWIDGDVVMQVQFVGPPEAVGGELIPTVLKLVQSKLDTRP